MYVIILYFRFLKYSKSNTLKLQKLNHQKKNAMKLEVAMTNCILFL